MKNFNDMLQAIDRVNYAMSNSNDIREFAAQGNAALRYLSQRMELTKRQCAILSVFIENCTDYRITLDQIANAMKVSTVTAIRYRNDIDKLELRGFVCHHKDNGNDYYTVPNRVIDAFKDDVVYQVPNAPTGPLTIEELFAELSTLFEDCKNEELSYPVFLEKIKVLLEHNKHLKFVKNTLKLRLDECDRLLLICFCTALVSDGDAELRAYHFQNFFERQEYITMRRELNFGNHALLNLGLLEYTCCDGEVDRSEYRLTNKARKELLSEAKIRTGEYRAGLRKHDKITAKPLFFNAKEQENLDDLCGMLSEENYERICQQLADNGMRRGIACLFYGGPGTGKTESVLQLAKRTGRDIMQIDISQMRSKWVGESEKNIKGVFEQYREAVNNSKIAPILLFNEADAILNKRYEGAKRGADKMENAMQNIILEELENLEGIFIATTNLANNMDPAFERRFLFKIHFHKPSAEVRTQIWKSMLPKETEERLAPLAEEFDFSGGQIENIARKYVIDSILHFDQEVDLHRYCESERITGPREKQAPRRIGFV